MAHVKFSIQFCYLDYHYFFRVVTGHIDYTLCGTFRGQKTNETEAGGGKKKLGKGEEMISIFRSKIFSLTIQTRNISPGVSSAGRP